MRHKVIYILFLFLLMGVGSVLANEQSMELWQKANNSYSAKEYEQALNQYLEIESKNQVSSSLYYNIGNSYFKLGQLANAILYYSRAEILDPSNKDIKHNLEVANAMTTTKIDAVPEFFLVSWFRALKNIAGSGSWAVLSLVSLGVALLLMILFWFSRKSIIRKISFTSSIFCMLLFFVSVIFASVQKQEIVDSKAAIVMNNSVAVKSSPDSSGKDIFILNEGVRVSTGEKIGGWIKITLASGQSGWIEDTNIEVV